MEEEWTSGLVPSALPTPRGRSGERDCRVSQRQSPSQAGLEDRQDCCLASEGKTAQLWTPFLSMLVKRDGVCQSFLDAEFRLLLCVPG